MHSSQTTGLRWFFGDDLNLKVQMSFQEFYDEMLLYFEDFWRAFLYFEDFRKLFEDLLEN